MGILQVARSQRGSLAPPACEQLRSPPHPTLAAMSQAQGGSDNSVVILPTCLFNVGNTQREQDLLNLPPPSCSANPGSANLFQLRTKTAMGAQSSFGTRNAGNAVAARKQDPVRK